MWKWWFIDEIRLPSFKLHSQYVEFLKDICMFESKGKILLSGNINTKVGKSNDVQYVIGMFGQLLARVMVLYWLNYYRFII